MLRKSIVVSTDSPFVLLPRNRKKCIVIAWAVIIQCMLVFIGGTSVLACYWKVNTNAWEYDMLARMMYLYDTKACNYTGNADPQRMEELIFSTDTRGFNVLPIRSKPAIVTVSSKLAEKTRRGIRISIVLHVIWLLTSIGIIIFTRPMVTVYFVKRSLTIFFYWTVIMIIFDGSMAIVYIAHLQQSVTKGMILRHTGWVDVKNIRDLNEFAGWLPMAATGCWLRGVLVYGLNIYICSVVSAIRFRIRKREVHSRLRARGNLPIPDAKYEARRGNNVLVYRSGEERPQIGLRLD